MRARKPGSKSKSKVAPWVVALGTVLAWRGCAGPEAPLVPEPPDASSPDLSQPPDASSPDLAPPIPPGDALPKGAISLFNRKTCPTGWETFMAGGGRTLVPTAGAAKPGTSDGEPLDDSEERQHGHGAQIGLNLPTVNYAGIAGEANHGVARGGSVPLAVSVSKVSAGLPYVQLLVCQKTADPDLRQRPAPTGTMMFFLTEACPAGWAQAGLSQGRFLVGLPTDGTADQKFGGKPLAAGEKRVHQHVVKGSIRTTSHGIALASGGAASGYARNDPHAYQGSTADESVQFPSLQLLQCQKQ